MINSVVLTGRLTADPEMRKTESGHSVTNFSIAVDRPRRKDQERITDFINVTAWSGTADLIGKYFKKGSLIGVEGTLRLNKYQDKEGNNRTTYVVNADRVHFLERAQNNAGNNTIQDVPEEVAPAEIENITEDDDLPF